VADSKKNARRRKAWIFFQDESGVSQRPPVRRTWAPKGETPIWIHAFNWKKMSICAALGYRWDGQRSKLYFQTREGSYNTPSLVQFLKDLKRLRFRHWGCRRGEFGWERGCTASRTVMSDRRALGVEGGSA